MLEVLHHLDPRQVCGFALRSTAGLRRGIPVLDSGTPLRAPVFGRMDESLGEVFTWGSPRLPAPNFCATLLVSGA